MSALSCVVGLRNFARRGIRCLCSSPDRPKLPRYAHLIESDAEKNFDVVKGIFSRSLKIKDLDDLPIHIDIVIIGGGVVGSCIAFWLKKVCHAGASVMVIDKDPTYQRCATTRSCGGIRQQFSLEENIRLSLFGAEFLGSYKEHLGDDAPDINFNPEGYLFTATSDEGAAQMEANYELQKQLGARVRLYSPEMLKKQFPFLNVEDVKLASYGLQNEGWFDPWSLLQGLKQSNIRNGVGYLHGEVVDTRLKIETVVGGTEMYRINELIIRLPDGTLYPLKFCKTVIAGGADSGHIGRIFRIGEGKSLLSVPIPVEPRKRRVFGFHAPDAPILGFPFLIDSTGTYVRREGIGGHFICGRSPLVDEEDPADVDLDSVDDSYFTSAIWPVLAKRVPAFENIKQQHAWCGLYDYNYLDENAIIGSHPYFQNVYICTGFSGHGLQMAPAAGRAMAELIFENGYTTLDLSRFSFDRVLSGERVLEQAII